MAGIESKTQKRFILGNVLDINFFAQALFSQESKLILFALMRFAKQINQGIRNNAVLSVNQKRMAALINGLVGRSQPIIGAGAVLKCASNLIFKIGKNNVADVTR